ncbi:DUF2971 domain-containing protein [Oleiharenicola sp. Vm1]|uniref:DUF2971 domain-containing protein n=1 Tax=Oleiharenicola sp. Vm1 TaxID=3398393 RepID=UPI0039F47A61
MKSVTKKRRRRWRESDSKQRPDPAGLGPASALCRSLPNPTPACEISAMTRADIERMDEIFFPNLASAMKKASAGGFRLAYYTTAETAMRILANQEVWLRNTAVMNDYMEVQHGMRCLHEAWQKSDGAKRVKSLLEELHAGAVARLESTYNSWHTKIQSDTFIACVSEHQASENDHGRLSMWRAYGGKAGVAFVFKPDFLSQETNAIGAYSHPVSYLDGSNFAVGLNALADRMEQAKPFLKNRTGDEMHNIAFSLLLWSAIATKHPGFAEEREWRVVAVPSMWKSEIMRQTVEVVRGIPQPVLKLPLRNFPAHNIWSLAIPELLDRIVIGPCDNPRILARAFSELLSQAGVKDVAEKITSSGIPLRHLV